MYFEFESTNISNSQDQSKSPFSTSLVKSRRSNQISPSLKSSPSIPSPLAIDNSSSTNHISSTINQQQQQQQRHRRYSLHSCHTPTAPIILETLKENALCDLALITKKKLQLINCDNEKQPRPGTFLKSLDESYIEPDIKFTQTFVKHNNSDLRKEVLLASIQRSLSFSTEDLLSFSPKNNSLHDDLLSTTNNETGYHPSRSTDDDYPMDSLPISTLPFSSANLSDNSSIIASKLVTDTFVRTDIPETFNDVQKKRISIYGQPKSGSLSFGGSYMPPETHNNLNSSTTFTPTTSMAGSKNPKGNIPSGNNCRNYIKNLNINPMNSNGFSTNMGNYYSRTSTSSSNLTNTVQSSPIRTSLKKRLYSTSPSKYSSNPYQTVANSISNNKEFNSIYSPSSSSSTNTFPCFGSISPEWEIAFKRLKVMHNRNESESDSALDNAPTLRCEISSSHQFGKNNLLGHQKDLNELAQDFHRLKTPFT